MSLETKYDFFWSCTSDSVASKAAEFTVDELVAEVKGNHVAMWKAAIITGVIIQKLKVTGVKPQDLVKYYVNMMGQGNLEYLYRVKGLSKKSIDTMIEKGLLITESKSRLREDDREMVYWTEVRLATKLENALK